MSSLHITNIETHVLRYKVEPEQIVGYADGWVTDGSALMVEVLTDDGIVGIGETCNDPPKTPEEIVQRICFPFLKRRNEAVFSKSAPLVDMKLATTSRKIDRHRGKAKNEARGR
jgi:L-alanine-DL-glutamate epimerase-like enolase superfamily enzyme